MSFAPRIPLLPTHSDNSAGFVVDLTVDFKRDPDNLSISVAVDPSSLSGEDPFADVTLSYTPFLNSAREALSGLDKIAGESQIVVGLKRYSLEMLDKVSAISTSPDTDGQLVEATIQKNIRTGTLKSEFKKVVREIERQVPDFFLSYKRAGILDWVESGFSSKKLPLKITFAEPNSAAERELGSSDGVFLALQNRMVVRGPGPDVATACRSLLVMGCMPIESDIVLHEVLHSKQDMFASQLRSQAKLLKLAIPATILPLLVDMSLKSSNLINENQFTVGLIGIIATMYLFKLALDRGRRALDKDMGKGESQILGEADVYHAFGYGNSGYSFHRAPADKFADTIAAGYKHDGQSMQMPHHIRVKYPCDRPNSLEAIGLEPQLESIAYRVSLRRLAHTSYNAIHSLRLLISAGETFTEKKENVYTDAWFRGVAQKATLRHDGKYAEIENAIGAMRQRLGLEDESIWKKVAPALHAWSVTEELHRQHQVRQIAQQVLSRE